MEWGTANARNQLVKVGKKQSSLDAFLQPTQAEAEAVPETGVRLLPLLSFAIPPPCCSSFCSTGRFTLTLAAVSAVTSRRLASPRVASFVGFNFSICFGI